MKKLLLLVIVLGGAWWLVTQGLPMVQGRTAEEEARRRVESMFGAWARDDEQTALWMWAEGRRLDLDGTSAYLDRFTDFTRRLGMVNERRWEVVATDTDGRWSRVAVSSELTGRRTLRVRSNEPIELVDE